MIQILCEALEEFKLVSPTSVQFLELIRDDTRLHLEASSSIGSGFTTSNRNITSAIRKIEIVRNTVGLAPVPKATLIQKLIQSGKPRRSADQLVIDLHALGFLSTDENVCRLTNIADLILSRFKQSRPDLWRGNETISAEGQASLDDTKLFLEIISKGIAENIDGAYDTPYYSWKNSTGTLIQLLSEFDNIPNEDKSLALLNVLATRVYAVRGSDICFDMELFRKILLPRISYKEPSLLEIYDAIEHIIRANTRSTPFRDEHLSTEQLRLINLFAPFASKLLKGDSLFSYRHTSNIIKASIEHFSTIALAPIIIPAAETRVTKKFRSDARVVSEKIRNTRTPELLKTEAKYLCQLCQTAPKESGGCGYVEAAHLIPFREIKSSKDEDSDGDPGNYFIVCPNHHKNIDKGSFKLVEIIESSKKIRVSVENVTSGDPVESTFLVTPTTLQIQNWPSLKKSINRFR